MVGSVYRYLSPAHFGSRDHKPRPLFGHVTISPAHFFGHVTISPVPCDVTRTKSPPGKHFFQNHSSSCDLSARELRADCDGSDGAGFLNLRGVTGRHRSPIDLSDTICPRYSISVWKKAHLDNFRMMFSPSIVSNT